MANVNNNSNKNDTPNKMNSYERILRLLEYLKRNTHSGKTASFNSIKEECDENSKEGKYDITGSEKTFREMIRAMDNVLNDDRQLSDRRIVYGNPNEPCEGQKMTNIFYQAPLSEEDVFLLEQGVFSVPDLSRAEADRLLDKIDDIAGAVTGTGRKNIIQKTREPVLQDNKAIDDNLKKIKKAIIDEKRIRFSFNGYGADKKLEAVGSYVVSPYYIAAYSGRFYLIGAADGYASYSIWRIDLMTDVSVDESLMVPLQNIVNLRDELALSGGIEGFLQQHIHMSFDAPEKITLKIKRVRQIADFTFLHDWFGDCFEIKESEPQNDGYDIVAVRCSPFGLVNWALQYSDRVEVLSPPSVREAVVEKIKNLQKKYLISE